MAVDHYENFPVASLLMPARLRPAVVAIYRFARTADDAADEGECAAHERLAVLGQYGLALEAIARGEDPAAAGLPLAPPAVFAPLAAAIARHRLPLAPFHRLLAAFRQDVTTSRHPDFDSLLDYCTKSANPVGELMLHLYGAASPTTLRDSDAICTGLQLVNFWQDVAIDWQRGRVYLPGEDLARFGVDPAALPAAAGTPAFRALMRFEVERARELLASGAGLAARLPGRVGWELRFVVCGGLAILDRIEAVDYDVFHARPVLRRRDWLAIAGRVLTYRHAARRTPALS